jgi:nucleoside-diphosphate-sugar epimerase
MTLKKILVTGATGFLGNSLINELRNHYKNDSIFPVLRKATQNFDDFSSIIINGIDSATDWKGKLEAISCVIHCAARVHVMNENEGEQLELYREVNVHGTLALANASYLAGVKRFIFISSIKVNGESTKLGEAFYADDRNIPTDPYGLSKYEAEVGLRKIADQTGMEVVIIRPPLVYGGGVKANFSSMMKWVYKGIPLPLSAITENKRSLVSVENLVNLIIVCITHSKAANQVFLVSDNDDVSTTMLLKRMAEALKVPSRLLPIPVSWFIFIAKLIGKPNISQRLCGSLQVDITKTQDLLDWTPPFTSSECMQKTADTFLTNLNK